MPTDRPSTLILLAGLLCLSAGLMAQAPAAAIVGTWTEESVMQVTKYAGRSACDTTITFPKGDTVTFLPDLRMRSVSDRGRGEGTYSIDNGWLQEIAADRQSRSGAQITELSAHKLVLHAKGHAYESAVSTESTITFVR